MAQSNINLDEELEYLVSDLKTEISQSTALKVNIFFHKQKKILISLLFPYYIVKSTSTVTKSSIHPNTRTTRS